MIYPLSVQKSMSTLCFSSCLLIVIGSGLMPTCTSDGIHLRQVDLVSPMQFATPPMASHTWLRMQGCAAHHGIKNVVFKPSWCRHESEYLKAHCPLLYSKLRQQESNARMEVSPLWCGPGIIIGFILNGKSYR